MKARIRSAVLSDGERPRSIWRNRLGSPTACMPSVVGLRPVLPRNAFSRVLNCSSRVCMRAVPTVSWPVTLKGPLPGSQLLGNLLSVRGARSYPTLSGRLWRPPPVQWRTPPRGRGCEAGGVGCEARPEGRPGHGRLGVAHTEMTGFTCRGAGRSPSGMPCLPRQRIKGFESRSEQDDSYIFGSICDADRE